MSELKVIGHHAGTVLVGQLAVMAFGVADTVIAGRYSDHALSALSVGAAIYISVYVALIGIVQALLPIWAELRGARRHVDLGRSVRQSLYLCGALTVAGMAALLSPGPLLRWAEVPVALQGEIQHYLAVLAAALMPSLLFRAYSTFNQSLGRPLLITWLQTGALAVKVPLSVWLVAGGAGMPALGVAGCAWATLVVNYGLALLALVMLRTQAFYQPYRIWQKMEAPDWQQISGFARLGIPGGLAYLVEVTSFTLMAVFIARLGTVASASHQIAASAASVLYMVPFSIAIACSARVSFWLGAARPDLASHVAWIGFRLTALLAIGFGALFLVANHVLAGLYSKSPQVVEAASALLLWVAAFHLADAVQAVCAFLLRCYRITLTPLVLYSVLLWGLGLLGGYRLAYEGLGFWAATQSAKSFWMASTFALWLVALCFSALLWRAVRHSARVGVKPEVAVPAQQEKQS
ncbi:MATE family efflux transporter [Polaromonas sp. A23]|uniref:MATE family efflux transporter n=1 Tax=Polaromonas sp. A23 TaxID=1944133 RepID=UPI0009857E08|nr:MATE family efflux transporter [Polaromonas sp. A23]OOG40501.1 MATE family efflux transporter [Polaromonas sp. A23]